MLRVALAALVGLMLSSIAFAWPSAHRASPGYTLAAVKLVGLGFLFVRVRQARVYTLQWSSMFILLFMAEGIVRAMGDPEPGPLVGTLEALAATVYFAAVLAYLRPLKKAARDSARPPREVVPPPARADAAPARWPSR